MKGIDNLGCFERVFLSNYWCEICEIISPFFLGGGTPLAPPSGAPVTFPGSVGMPQEKNWNFMKEIDNLGCFERIFLSNYSCEICEFFFFLRGGAPPKKKKKQKLV